MEPLGLPEQEPRAAAHAARGGRPAPGPARAQGHRQEAQGLVAVEQPGAQQGHGPGMGALAAMVPGTQWKIPTSPRNSAR